MMVINLYVASFLCISMLVLMHIADCQASWFDRLPDERMSGVPKVLLNNEKHYKTFRNMVLSNLSRKKSPVKKTTSKAFEKLVRNPTQFPCQLNNTRSIERPTSIHFLRPGDIDVVAALGDSLTAANGGFAKDLFRLIIENRGISPFIGGEGTWEQYLTLPNVLKEFNPNLIGYSLSDSFSHHKESGFNMAEMGAMSQDLPFMAKQLVKRVKRDPRVNFQEDWKLVVVFIGPNNFCFDICYLRNASTSIEAHKDDLEKTFQYLMDKMPRTIVIFLQTINMKTLVEIQNFPASCRVTHMFECPCLFTMQHIPKRKQFFQVLSGWQRVDAEVANDLRFRRKEDFAIVHIPFTGNISMPIIRNPMTGQLEPDISIFSHDCFHFSQYGNGQIARALWNSIMQEEGRKTTYGIDELDKFRCPAENSPYIPTWKMISRA